MTGTFAALVEHQLEVASLSGEVDAVMQGIVDRLMELPVADGASSHHDRYHQDSAHFRVACGADEQLLGQTFHLAETLGNECLAPAR